MLEVKFLIETRKNYPLMAGKDTWIDEINKLELQKEIFFVVPEGFLFSKSKGRQMFDERYYIKGVFDVSAPYTNTNVNMVLVQATSTEKGDINIGIFNGASYDKRKNRPIRSEIPETPESFLPEFNKYIEELEKWINEGITPDSDRDGRYEYNVIPMDEINKEKLYPKYYSRQALAVREFSKKEKLATLSEVADILVPKEDRASDEEVKRLRLSDLHYPLNEGNISYGKPTSVILQKGDIVFPKVGDSQPFLFNTESAERIYASPQMAVIKCKNILPEYLYLYLISDTAVQLINMEKSGAVIKHLSMKDIASLPIAIPTAEEQKYIEEFEVIANPEIRHYGNQAERIFTYSQNLSKHYKNVSMVRDESAEYGLQAPKKIEDVLNMEMAAKIKVHNEEQLRGFLTDDLKELNTCFRGKAYKATLILAGSILEAILIDWLSELNQKDYFKDDYIVKDRRTGRERRADLVDYINEIKYIERPNWMEEADKAHTIRKKRNLVHAKLCLKSDEVNEETCRQVIEYLKDVLRTRGVS